MRIRKRYFVLGVLFLLLTAHILNYGGQIYRGGFHLWVPSDLFILFSSSITGILAIVFLKKGILRTYGSRRVKYSRSDWT